MPYKLIVLPACPSGALKMETRGRELCEASREEEVLEHGSVLLVSLQVGIYRQTGKLISV